VGIASLVCTQMTPNLLRHIISVRQSNPASKPHRAQKATGHAIN
jgi:hypothetical protein